MNCLSSTVFLTAAPLKPQDETGIDFVNYICEAFAQEKMVNEIVFDFLTPQSCRWKTNRKFIADYKGDRGKRRSEEQQTFMVQFTTLGTLEIQALQEHNRFSIN